MIDVKKLKREKLGAALVLALVGSLVTAVAVYAAVAHQSTDVFRLSDSSVVAGSSAKLTRNDGGVTVNLKTSDLEAGAAYTVWWVIFNNPAACSVPNVCGLVDLLPGGTNEAVQSTAFYAAGHVIGNNGKGNFSARLREGTLPTGDDQVVIDSSGGQGLIDSMAAEIHVAMRTHGQPIPGLVNEQLQSFNGGCNAGEPNEGLCEDVQAAVFLAP